jgi:transcriptional regulator with XRE-family HTH domain
VRNNLQKWRVYMGYTQAQLCKKLKISLVMYSKYEKGTKDPPYQVLMRIAHFYDIRTNQLLTLD